MPRSRSREGGGLSVRAGVDENIGDDGGNTAKDMVGIYVGEEDRLAEDIERVRKLLANVPADRAAWRRQGYLVLCRANPDRVQEVHAIGGTHHADTSRAEAGGCHEVVVEGRIANEGTDGDWAVVVSKMLLLPEEGIFRTIVGYVPVKPVSRTHEQV